MRLECNDMHYNRYRPFIMLTSGDYDKQYMSNCAAILNVIELYYKNSSLTSISDQTLLTTTRIMHVLMDGIAIYAKLHYLQTGIKVNPHDYVTKDFYSTKVMVDTVTDFLKKEILFMQQTNEYAKEMLGVE